MGLLKPPEVGPEVNQQGRAYASLTGPWGTPAQPFRTANRTRVWSVATEPREEPALVEAGRGEGGREWGMGSQEEGWEKHPKHSANTQKGW